MSAAKRRFAQSSSKGIGTDSFMDIVFNVLGGLFIVVIYAAVATSGVKATLTLPMSQPAETSPVFFECRDGTTFYSDVGEVVEEGIDYWNELDLSDEEKMARLEDRYIGNERYRFGVIGEPGRLQAVAYPGDEAPGESAAELMAAGSEFRERLAEFEPGEKHVFFIVRPDSFAVFHTARRVAIQMGFRVGYQPWKQDGHIGISSGSGGHGSRTET